MKVWCLVCWERCITELLSCRSAALEINNFCKRETLLLHEKISVHNQSSPSVCLQKLARPFRKAFCPSCVHEWKRLLLIRPIKPRLSQLIKFPVCSEGNEEQNEPICLTSSILLIKNNFKKIKWRLLIFTFVFLNESLWSDACVVG